MPEFDPKAFGSRLRGEMRERGVETKALQEDVRERTGGARGTSYGSVWSYVNGQAPVEPRREVVEAMAVELGVLPEYLLHGGPRTLAEAEVASAHEAEQPRFYARMLEELPRLKEFDPGLHMALLGVLERWATACERSGMTFDEDEVETHMLGFLLSSWAFMWQPLESWARWLGREIQSDQRSVSDYLMAMCHALNLSMQAVAPPGLTADVVESWPPLPAEEEDPS
jgi:hypothetical protein